MQHRKTAKALPSVVLFILGVLVGACQSAARPVSAPSRAELAYDLQAKTVALTHTFEIEDEKKTAPYCSGIWVSDSGILTAHHCVSDEEIGADLDYAVHDDIYASGELHTRADISTRHANLQATDEDHDLALLRAVDSPSHRVARVALDTIRPGAFVQTMGHPMGMWWSYSSGDVAAVYQRDIAGRNILWIQATAPISLGNSGGGLFDESNRLIGTAAGVVPKGQLVNLFVHAQYLDAFLRQHGI